MLSNLAELNLIFGVSQVIKTSFTLAFRQIPIQLSDFKWLVMKAKHPSTGVVYYFVDKALPFGSSRYFNFQRRTTSHNLHKASCQTVSLSLVDNKFVGPARSFNNSATA